MYKDELFQVWERQKKRRKHHEGYKKPFQTKKDIDNNIIKDVEILLY